MSATRRSASGAAAIALHSKPGWERLNGDSTGHFDSLADAR